MSLPDPAIVRSRIEKVTREDMRNFLKALYLIGAARAYEMTGRNIPSDSTHRNVVYGPKGTDVTKTNYRPTELSATQAALIISGEMKPTEAFKLEPIALFRIKIAKRQLLDKQEPYSRLVGLPLNPEYEPWTQELYNYFRKAENNYVFPFSRQQAWYWITHKEPVFKGLTYPIQTYRIKDKTNEMKKIVIPVHQRKFKLHALRHLRVNELVENYGFDGLDYAAYVGWSLSTAPSNISSVPIPPMLKVYGTDIYEKWKRYIGKLLKKRTW